jgi:hypothetical protein
MLRFLMVKKFKVPNGYEGERFYSLDSVDDLETFLKSGGHSEDSYEVHELIGIEIVK